VKRKILKDEGLRVMKVNNRNVHQSVNKKKKNKKKNRRIYRREERLDLT
jgi:hypothetical protein